MISDAGRKKIEELWNEVFKSKGETPPKVIVLDGGATLSVRS